MNNSQPAPRRRVFQFSLAVLLVLIAVAPLAIWRWWQRPYQVEVVQKVPAPAADPFGVGPAGRANPYGGAPARSADPFGAAPAAEKTTREVRTERRRGLDDSVRDGPTVTYDENGVKLREENYKNGILHGPYRVWNTSEQLTEEGEYADGEQHGRLKKWDRFGNLIADTKFDMGRQVEGARYAYRGKGVMPHKVFEFSTDEQTGVTTVKEWIGDRETLVRVTARRDRKYDGPFKSWYDNGAPEWVGEYVDGKRHGEWLWRGEHGKYTCTFKYDRGVIADLGRLQTTDGAAVDSLVSALRQQRPNAPAQLFAMLDQPADVDFIETPLSDVVLILEDRLAVQISLDTRAIEETGKDAHFPITVKLQGLPAANAFDLMLYPHGLTLDYRHEHLWITTRDSFDNWIDRFGASEQAPPADSQLAAALDESSDLDFIRTPLPLIVKYLAQRHKIRIELDREAIEKTDIAIDAPVTANLRGMSLRATLGALLEPLSLACEERDGVLLIRPAK